MQKFRHDIAQPAYLALAHGSYANLKRIRVEQYNLSKMKKFLVSGHASSWPSSPVCLDWRGCTHIFTITGNPMQKRSRGNWDKINPQESVLWCQTAVLG